MDVISVRGFMGEVPLMSKQLLQDGMAVTASNTKLQRGNLQPWRQTAAVATLTKPGTIRTLYRFGESSSTDAQYWFAWTTDVDCVKAPIHGDTTERTYFTGDGYPKKTNTALALSGGTNYPMNAYRLGMPIPDASTATGVVSGTPTNAADTAESVAYVITYVSEWGEESAPSETALGPFECKPGQKVTLNNLPGAPTGNYNVTHKRLYRSATGSEASDYQFVVELTVATVSYEDTLSTPLGAVLATDGWYPPPDNGFGLTLGANGNAIILSGKTVHPCVPFALYAYPEEYQLTTESDLVGAGALAQGFVVLTKSNPYIITGVDPAGYTMTRLDENQACVSKSSIVEMMGGVAYASPDGLWHVSLSGMTNLTKDLMTKDDWQALKPESIHGYELDGRYHLFYDNGTTQGQIIFDFGRTPFMTRSNVYCTAAYNDPLRDSLYLAQGSSVVKWDGGAPATYLWRSKEYTRQKEVSYAYARVEADAYPVTLRFYAEQYTRDAVTGVVSASFGVVHTESVVSAQPFRLPPLPTRRCAIELEGTTTVHLAVIATDIEGVRRA